MKVKDLIARLEAFDPDMPVAISYQYGDRCRTIAANVHIDADEQNIARWGYGGPNAHCVIEDDEQIVIDCIEAGIDRDKPFAAVVIG